MSELIPIQQAERIRTALLDYLTTTFALDNLQTREVLAQFLSDPAHGVFRGPYARLRLPFRAADEGWESAVDWRPDGLHPYAHQAAAWKRLSSKPDVNPEGPQPTLVTTGTGSGKTESFLIPILDHVARERRLGHTGMKALILYPMNALAGDQANRLASYITENAALNGVRAAIYVGDGSHGRKGVTKDGLITDRDSIRAEAPDILLTNYKMLDQLLLRPADQELWRQSALSLQYLVLDEFHTYDGAQGTDVAMLLRRLGLALKAAWPDGPALEDARQLPLGRITPVATSATLGGGDAAPMVDFANTVFGGGFDATSVIGETRQSIDEWAEGVMSEQPGGESFAGFEAGSLRQTIRRVNEAVPYPDDLTPAEAAQAVANALVAPEASVEDASRPSEWSDDQLLALMATHPLLRRLVQAASRPRKLDDLCDALTDTPSALVGMSKNDREHFVALLLTLCSHVRAVTGRRAPNVDVHLWLRELSRVNRSTTTDARFIWSDDGIRRSEGEAEDATDTEETHYEYLPAIYCRRCGRSGWMSTGSSVSDAIEVDPQTVRTKSGRDHSQQRPLIFAREEGELALATPSRGKRASAAPERRLAPGLQWLHTRDNRLVNELPSPDDEDFASGWILPVLGLTGDHVKDDAANDTCPACGTANSIRYIGSAIATMLSVAVSTLFGATNLDGAEKKALIFTDSVQDAAHRAGFIEARSRVFTFRSLLREAAGDGGTLPELVERAVEQAGDDLDERFRLIPPSLVEHEGIKPYWDPKKRKKAQIERARKNVVNRLLFDAEAEFGRFGDLGRTLELTGTLSAGHGLSDRELLSAAREAVVASREQETLDGLSDGFENTDAALLAWAHGVLYRMRRDGAILHPWLKKYLEEGGALYQLQGGRKRREGQPWLGRQSRIPSFPYARTASKKTTAGSKASLENLVNIGSPRSWYSIWGSRVLQTDHTAAARHTRALFVALTKQGVLEPIEGSSRTIIAYGLPPEHLRIEPVDRSLWLAGRYRLRCDTCHTVEAAEPRAVSALLGAPCLNARCSGHLESLPGDDGAFYRRLYESHMRTVITQEHTGLLEDAARQTAEQGFRGKRHSPDAPNVLVATPTLELGIDIGDLSTVLLASLPKTNANYQQRVGRAGRLTGNALDMAFIRGRGKNLPVLDDPLKMIDGEVQPPATYLSAEEILQRQYFAFLMDTIARDGSGPQPLQSAADVLGHAATDTVLGEVIRRAHSGNVEWATSTFVHEFGTHVDPEVATALAQWATPDATGESGLSRRIDEAVATYRQTGERIAHRLKHVEDSLEGLQRSADSARATDEDRRALSLAVGALKMLRKMKSEHAGTLPGTNGYWISALEEYGLLPNYTLLDDSVELSVELSWYDADSGEYKSDDPIRIQRGAVSAITEFAPGSTFYARGRALQIDAVDLGADGGDVRTWAQCPECGFAQDLTGEQQPLTVCPRCGSGGIADRGQQLQVVDLARVSSQEDRDRTLIGTDDEDRRRTYFTTVTCADIDHSKSTGTWYVQGNGFGATYLRSLRLRELNLGKTVAGRDIRIAGQDISAALFTVCSACGKLDRKGDTNSPAEHRPWCPHRLDKEEHNRQIALARSLTTQGVALTLPAGLAEQDSFVLPSLKAALLFGLQLEFGGDPSHITVTDVLIPDRRPDQPNDRGLLLHDQVPGGTGYLASFGTPEHVWHLLREVWLRLRTCSCRGEDVLACEHCLLPFAGFSSEHVSRATAERCLESILTSNGKLSAEALAEDSASQVQWDVTEEQPVITPYDSPLEGRFVARFSELLKDRGAGIKEVPGAHGNSLHIRLPGQRHEWRLQPQVELAGTRPDFGLVHSDTNDPEIMIYTDGYQYHGTPTNDHVVDDAQKRTSVRNSADRERLVFSFVWDEIDSDSPAAPYWWNQQKQEKLIQKGIASQTMLQIVQQGPLAVMIDLFSGTDADRWDSWRRYTAALPVGIGDLVALSPHDDLRAIALAELDDAGSHVADAQQLRAGQELSLGTMWRHGPTLLLSRLKHETQSWETVLTIDERQVGEDGFHEAWNSWTQLGSLLGLNRWGTTIDTRLGLKRALASEGTETSSSGRTDLPSPSVSMSSSDEQPLADAEWAALVEDARADGDDRLVKAIRQLGLELKGPVPELWAEETAEGIPVPLSFRNEQVAVVLPDTEDDDRRDLVAEGWIVVELQDVSAIERAVNDRCGNADEKVDA